MNIVFFFYIIGNIVFFSVKDMLETFRKIEKDNKSNT